MGSVGHAYTRTIGRVILLLTSVYNLEPGVVGVNGYCVFQPDDGRFGVTFCLANQSSRRSLLDTHAVRMGRWIDTRKTRYCFLI